MSCISYEEALSYLRGSYAKGIKAGLEGVRKVLDELDKPQERLRVVHVAGTNGKGSTVAFLQNILIAAGIRVGAFTSPHLLRFNERLCVDLLPVSDEDFAKYLKRVADASAKYDLRMSFFEILTCMAYIYFAEAGVDVAIIETGIGGRLDATNVIEQALLSVITAPGLDHQELLGNSPAEIASEDAGIIKEGCPVAVYPSPVYDTIAKIAIEKNAPIYYIGKEVETSNLEYKLDGTIFSVKTAYFSHQSLSIRLLGEHQLQNALHVLLCVEALRDQGLSIPDKSIREGLSKTKWPGRFELASTNPYLILDGAHNEDGADIFNKALKRYFPNKKIILLVGISDHKDYESILRHMIPMADKVICTCASYKAMPAQELSKCIKNLSQAPIQIEEDYKTALQQAKIQAGPEGVVAAAGSLYLIGDLKSL